MRIKEKRTIIEKRTVVVGYRCDKCGVKVDGEDIPNDWHLIDAYHLSWGNDSCDSNQYYLACSPECYSELLKEAVDEFSEYHTSVVDGMRINFATELSKYLMLK